MSSDDLHELAHGECEEDGSIAAAIVRHPLCDWGSAFEILHSYSAAAYQSYWKDGKPESSFGTVDQVLFDAFATIAMRAASEGFPTRKFKHYLEIHRFGDEQGKPNPYHPSNWIKWSLPRRVLEPTDDCKHNPSVVLEGGRILPNFEFWLTGRARLH
ncbi:hypothetical protein [Tateyamaria omphalii]|uniref:hypothetical protein n=1 Tax=Tateyamaria omphalii TaxID=299262 RepID=UPI0016742D7F|nr:hypothetical protein [Tateyamaria omphalii]